MKDIRIYGIYQMENAIAQCPGDFGLVSILSPTEPRPSFVEEDNEAHLYLQFHDVDEDRPGALPPSIDHVQSIVDASEAILAHKTVLCHCFGGVSRSTAAAIILHYLDSQNPHEAVQAVYGIKGSSMPNRLLLSHADELFGTDLETLVSNTFDYYN